MFIVALTGGIGSGKSTAAAIFAELGVPITDVDVISHQLSAANQPLVADIAANFGSAYITADNALNRVAMRNLVFNDDRARAKLNAILHPAIYTEALSQLTANQAQIDKNAGYSVPYQILVIPLLFESPRYAEHVDRILLIDADEKVQIKRVKARSQLSESAIRKIMRTQTPRKKQLKLAHDVIENNENVEKLHEKIMLVHEKYINTCILSKTIS